MFVSLGLLVFNLLILATEPATDKILPAQNLTLRWITAFKPELSWEPPQHSAINCTYVATIATADEDEEESSGPLTTPTYSVYKVMEGGFLHWSVKTYCNGDNSREAVFSLTYRELVKDLKCYSYTATEAVCSWSRKHDNPDLRFFYQLVDENGNEHSELRECSSYDTNGVLTSCGLQATTSHTVFILFNGTWNKTSVRNTFKRDLLREGAEATSPHMERYKRGNKLDVSWVPPDILGPSFWKYRISYTECNKMTELIVKERTYQLNRVPHCRYCISVVAESNAGSTRPSNEKCVDADEVDVNLMYIALIIPLVLTCMAPFALMCYRKNKDSIFPKVPQPRDFLSDISNNNNESTLFNLYCPAEEEVSCKVTLVANTQTIKLDY